MGMFDDLIPQQQTAPKAGGMFDDLIPAKAAAPQAPAGTSWSDVGLQALQNAPGSALQFGKDIAQPFLHPIDTMTNISNLGVGALEKTGLIPKDQNEELANAVGQHFANRFGSVEGFKKALASDPVGVAGDLSMALTGGESALARLPGAVGKVGEAAGAVGRAVDPLRAVTNAGSIAGNRAAGILGMSTGAGTEPIKLAAQAGYEGGPAAQAFREHLTGAAPMSEPVNEARNAIRQMRQERGDAYLSGMSGIKADNTVLDFSKINDALDRAQAIKTYKGQSLSPSTQDIRGEMRHTINEWETFDPQEFHTPEGLDALKQKLGDMRDNAPYNTPQRAAADTIYNAVRQTIVDQVPEYAKVMEGYSEASDMVSNIERELSLKKTANVDTALRKLQSVLRDNVNTSFGRRAELANYLVSHGAPNLLEKLAGQALKSWEPRGIARGIAAGVGLPEIGKAVMSGRPLKAAGMAATYPLMSPRLMGEAAYYGGAGARKLAPIAQPLGATLRPARQLGSMMPQYQNPYP